MTYPAPGAKSRTCMLCITAACSTPADLTSCPSGNGPSSILATCKAFDRMIRPPSKFQIWINWGFKIFLIYINKQFDRLTFLNAIHVHEMEGKDNVTRQQPPSDHLLIFECWCQFQFPKQVNLVAQHVRNRRNRSNTRESINFQHRLWVQRQNIWSTCSSYEAFRFDMPDFRCRSNNTLSKRLYIRPREL